jgi:hypothetical protein
MKGNNPMNETPIKVPDWSAGKKVMVGELFLGLYQPSPETTGFWEGVKRRELLFKHCECGQFHHPRRMLCSVCSSQKLSWKKSTGIGSVYSFSEIHRAPTPEYAQTVPYTVGLIETAEGVHFFCRIDQGRKTPIAIGDKAKLDFRVLESGYQMPVFITHD